MNSVSIAMCTYNGERYLSSQLDSLVSQDYPLKEIVICDDCSKDRTIDIIDDYIKKYPKLIRLYINDSNIGYIKNFEKAISLCGGDLVALADQDDFWEPHKIYELVNAIGDFDLIHSDAVLIDECDNIISQSYASIVNKISNQINFFGLLQNNCVTGCTCLFKNRLYQNSIPFPLNIPHDHYLALCALLGSGMTYLDKKLVKYRQHDNNAIGAIKKTDSSRMKRSRYDFHKSKARFYKEVGNHFNNRGNIDISKTCDEYYEYYNSFLTKRIRFKAFLFHLTHFHEFSSGKKAFVSIRALIGSLFGSWQRPV